MIKKHHDVIVRSVIKMLGREFEREKKEVLYPNDWKAARKAKKGREQTGPTNANYENNQAPFRHPNPVESTLAEPSLETRAIRMDSAQIDLSKELVTDVADRGANRVHQIVGESIVSGEAKKPGSAKRQHGNAANPSSSIRGITPNPIRLCNKDHQVPELE